MKILLIEDDRALNTSLKESLSHEGYAVTSFLDGKEGARHLLINALDYDIVIVDWMLPGKTGVEICQDARKSGITLPIIMLTARDETDDKIKALDIGADDYLTKPFSLDELFARIRALLRRPGGSVQNEIEHRDLVLNQSSRTVLKAGKNISLTQKEFNILEYFMRNPNKVISRDEVLDHIWDYNFSSLSNIMDVHITNLRNKLSKNARNAYIETIRGVGYRLKL